MLDRCEVCNGEMSYCGANSFDGPTLDCLICQLREKLAKYEFILDVLRLADKYEIHNMLWWRTDGEYSPATFFVKSNDLLFWGCADAEPITPENLDDLEQAIKDCESINSCAAGYGCNLFVCRMSKTRPQGAMYPIDIELWPLFNECGPEREVGFGNPYKPGEYKR